MAFETLYTGKGSSVKLPSGQPFQQASERLSDFITRAEELKFKVYRENEQEFLKNANITPEFVLADSARKATAGLIDSYNKKWAKIFQQRASTGGLTMEEKQQMATEKNWIISQNQSDVAAMGRYQAMKEVVRKNPMLYDQDEFNLLEANYLNSGIFEATEPPIKGVSPLSFYSDQKNRVIGTAGETRMIPIGGGQHRSERDLASRAEGEADVEYRTINDPQFRKGVITEFAALEKSDPDTFKKYLDINNDNTISPEERKNINPIIQWARDKYWRNAIRQEFGAAKNIPKPETEGDVGNVSAGGGYLKSVAPGKKRAQPVLYGEKGKEISYDTYAFGGVLIKNVPTAGADAITEYSTDDLSAGSVSAELLEYIPSEDKVIVRVVGGAENPDVASKTIIKLPASNIEGIDNFPIIENGKKITLGVLRGRKPAVALSWVEYKKQNPNATPQEYQAYTRKNGR